MTIKQIGIDIGKTTFHVIGIDDGDRSFCASSSLVLS